MLCCQFLCLSIRPFGEPLNPAADLFLHTNHPSAVLVKFHNYNERLARIWQVPTMRSRDILLQAKGDQLDQVRSDQVVLEMIRRGRLDR